MIEKTGIADILNFQPALSHDKIPKWLCSLDAFVLSSVSEGCPNILMEAMACGLPCVATRVGAVEDLMEDTISGLIVPWGNAIAITIELLGNIRHKRFLDYGCGPGMFLGHAAKSGASLVVGTNIKETALSTARYFAEKHEIANACAFLVSNQFPAFSTEVHFDEILLKDLIEHGEDDQSLSRRSKIDCPSSEPQKYQQGG